MAQSTVRNGLIGVAFGAVCVCMGLSSVMFTEPVVAADITRGTITGSTTAKGYDHPNQYLHVRPQKIADNMEPVIKHEEQEKQAREKLAALEKRFGKKPNVLIFLMDDVGWMDPGFNGGGVAVGNPTPTMDRLAHEGLILTSAYSTPSTLENPLPERLTAIAW